MSRELRFPVEIRHNTVQSCVFRRIGARFLSTQKNEKNDNNGNNSCNNIKSEDLAQRCVHFPSFALENVITNVLLE